MRIIIENNYKINAYSIETTDGVSWIAEYPELKGCVGGGDTKEEAIMDAEINKEVYLKELKITSRPWVFQDLLDDIKELAVSNNPNSETFTTLMMAHDFLESIPKAFRAANNAIYFDDSSDRLTALYDVCRALKPDQNVYGEEYIEE